jgi:transketolase
MRDSFIRALSELAAEDPRIVLVNGDLGFGVLNDFIERFPDQYINAGVAEQNMTAVACGMALEGARSYTYSIGNFTTLRCLEQLRNDVCYHDANVTAVAVGGGFSYGQLGMSHFATEDLAILRALPNMTVVAPSDPWQAYELTKQLYRRGGSAYLRLDKGSAKAPADGEPVELGKARLIRRGRHCVIFGIGAILGEALAAAELLAAEGIEATVVDIHTLKPLDTRRVVELAAEHRIVITVEEHNRLGGLGAAIAEVCLESGARIDRFSRIGIDDLYPTIVGDQSYLRRAYGLDADAIARRTRQLVSGKE